MKSIYSPSGVSTNYWLISMADDPLLAYEAIRPEGTKTLGDDTLRSFLFKLPKDT